MNRRHAGRVEMRGISKRYGPIAALRSVDFSIHPGEVHALLGQNGAGKSTLMDILFGLTAADDGYIAVDGQRVEIDSPARASALGIGYVQQHFSLVEAMTVAENILLGRLPGTVYRPRAAEREVQDFIDSHGFNLDAGALVGALPVGVRQRVEILKCLYRDARCIILDEPTSVLGPPEVESLFERLRALAAEGRSIVFITHKLKEVFRVSDRITVLREGGLAGVAATSACPEAALVEMMVGESLPPDGGIQPRTPGEKLLRVRNLSAEGGMSVHDISFELHAGETVGIGGIDGSGQRELAEALLGLRPVTGGTITWHAAAERPGLVPQDRSREGFVGEFSIAENLMLGMPSYAPFRKAGMLSRSKISSHASAVIAENEVVSSGPSQPVGELSGGNQQKLLVGRAFSARPRVLIAMNPTWGVDLGASRFIRARLNALRERGGGVLLFSTDLDELYAMCDRFLILYDGREIGRGNSETPRGLVGAWISGSSGGGKV